jgi:hypothetical protein
MKPITTVAAILVLYTGGAMAAPATGADERATVYAQACDDGHWIDAVLDDGRVIKLEDGSLWEVSVVDTITSSIWLPISDIVICGNKLINVDDNESVDARRLR